MEKAIFEVNGMTCGSCVRHINRALRALEGVDDVEVFLDRAEVVVEHDPAQVGAQALIAALNDAGYPSRRAG